MFSAQKYHGQFVLLGASFEKFRRSIDHLTGFLGATNMNCSPGSTLGLPAVIHSAAMRRVMEMVKRVAQTDASVLITGESGVGKELVARALHEQSLRCNSPWVDLNCGALPEHLVESESDTPRGAGGLVSGAASKAVVPLVEASR